MLLAEHLDPNPGGRPNELTDLAAELDAEAPFVLPDAKRKDYEDRNRLMGYTPDACILCNRHPPHGLHARLLHRRRQLRALHAGGDRVLGALPRGPRAARAHRPDLGALVA